MPRLPHKTAIGPSGDIVFAEGGVLAPGWKAAIAMLNLEAQIAARSVEDLADGGEVDTDRGTSLLIRLEGCQLAVELLKEQGRRIGLDV